MKAESIYLNLKLMTMTVTFAKPITVSDRPENVVRVRAKHYLRMEKLPYRVVKVRKIDETMYLVRLEKRCPHCGK